MLWRKKKGEKSNIELIKTIQKLEVSDGDVIVFSLSCPLPTGSYKNLKEALEMILFNSGYKVRVLLLECGLDIKAVLTKKRRIRDDVVANGH